MFCCVLCWCLFCLFVCFHSGVLPLITKEKFMALRNGFPVSVVASCIINLQCNLAAAAWLWIILPVEGKSLLLLNPKNMFGTQSPWPWDRLPSEIRKRTDWFFVHPTTTISFVDRFLEPGCVIRRWIPV